MKKSKFDLFQQNLSRTNMREVFGGAAPEIEPVGCYATSGCTSGCAKGKYCSYCCIA